MLVAYPSLRRWGRLRLFRRQPLELEVGQTELLQDRLEPRIVADRVVGRMKPAPALAGAEVWRLWFGPHIYHVLLSDVRALA